MSLNDFQPYLIPTILVVFFAWRFLRFRGVKRRLPALLSEGAKIIDVRTSDEYAAGSSKGSINIPLGVLRDRLGEFDREQPIILCCASGNRSSLAAAVLRRHGFKKVLNAGAWTNTV
jgi:phage shock protein E